MCAAPFCEPKRRDFGLASFGERGFGGLLPDICDNSPRTSFLPQYNLESFWRTEIPPLSFDLPRPMIEPRAAKLRLLRLPGSFTPETPDYELFNRNLLTAKVFENEEGSYIRVWTVNERSNCRTVELFDVQLDDRCLPKEEVHEKYDRRKKLKEAVMELRYSEVLDDEASEPVRSFEENTLFRGEIALIDYYRTLWWGELGHGLMRHKNDSFENDINSLGFGNHPRVLYAALGSSVKSIDVRTENSAAVSFFDTSSYDCKRGSDSGYVNEKPIPTPEIQHIRLIPDSPQNLIAISSHAVYLFDERFPGRPLITLLHSIPFGSHHVAVSRAVRDIAHGGDIVSFYALDQRVSGISATRLYHHRSGVWSSCHPFRLCDKPDDYNRLLKTSSVLRREADRSLALVQGLKLDAKDVDLLLRQLDDGSVWLQRLIYGNLQGDKKNEEHEESQKSIAKYCERNKIAKYTEKIDDVLKAGSDAFIKVLEIDGSVKAKDFGRVANKELRNAAIGLSFDSIPPPKTLEPLEFEVGAKLSQLVSDLFDFSVSDDVDMEVASPRPETPASSSIGLSDIEEIYEKLLLVYTLLQSDWCGFRGSHGCENTKFDAANLAQTYSALLCLSILGDDLSGVDRAAILRTITKSQKPDGSFWGQGVGSESDMRFVYCAVTICHILNDDEAIDWDRLGSFIRSSRGIDGGIGQGPGDESHGGSTYCAIASLAVANRLWNEKVLKMEDLDRVVKWAMWKQDEGFHGRAHKPDDSCYAFWIGATLEILNRYDCIDKRRLRDFLLIAQHSFMGGFCKLPEVGAHSDLLHTYFSLAAMSLLKEPLFWPVNAAMNVSRRAYETINSNVWRRPRL
ncbi:unnamed protein product [Caenorhabditis auriculariae]|uniref:Prenyltransferase alpha-alpha toroid domain-containing protein n=1 Tax=Caenorhabditis auriculariae TaxID=2777116 RepID=A0A8S1HK90_9PELO|nr:unnamed protein product [Caenorhabditis auriculariae]